jgi:hypothetical protein
MRVAPVTLGNSDLDRPMVIDQPHALDWRGGVPVSRRFDDPFYSLEDGLAEARHVFLGGNGLPARFRDGFHIAELGFGTGLNFAAARWRGGRPGYRASALHQFRGLSAGPPTCAPGPRALPGRRPRSAE